MNACNELQRTERLDHIIVCAKREPLDLILLGIACRQHDHGIGMAGTDRTQQLKAVDIRQHDIQQRQIKLLLQNRLGRIGPAVGNLDIKASFVR